MSEERTRSFLAARPGIRDRMTGSEVFGRIKREALLEMDGEELYIVRGDSLGSEEELFVEAVVRGAAGQGEANRELFAELDPAERDLIVQTFTK